MDILWEIIKVALPAIIVLLASILTLKQLLKNDQEKRRNELVIKNQQIITPVRLQAYERLTLFLERISIQSMVMRLNKESRNVQQFQSDLLNTIRIEFDHNISQQIYVSHQTWNIIKSAKENTIKIINDIVAKTNPDEPAVLLGKKLLEHLMELENAPTQIAIDFLKKEIRQFF